MRNKSYNITEQSGSKGNHCVPGAARARTGTVVYDDDDDNNDEIHKVKYFDDYDSNIGSTCDDSIKRLDRGGLAV